MNRRIVCIVICVVVITAIAFILIEVRRDKKRPIVMHQYTRTGDDTLEAFYKPYTDYMENSPERTVAFVELLTSKTGLPRNADEYPIDHSSIQNATRAFVEASSEIFDCDVSVDSEDPTQLDKLVNAYLIDPLMRPFFDGASLRDDMSEKESEEYYMISEKLKIPNEPLLYYCMGCFWGEWL